MKDTNSSSSLSSLILGAAIGAALTYLFTNKEGKKIREFLLEEGSKLVDEISEKTQEVEEKFEKSQIKQDLEEKIESPKEEIPQIEEMIEEVPQHINKLQKKGRHFFFQKPRSNES